MSQNKDTNAESLRRTKVIAASLAAPLDPGVDVLKVIGQATDVVVILPDPASLAKSLRPNERYLLKVYAGSATGNGKSVTLSALLPTTINGNSNDPTVPSTQPFIQLQGPGMVEVTFDPTTNNYLVSSDTGGIANGAPGPDLGDGDATITVSGGSWRRMPAATMSASRVVTLGTTGAKAGDQITVTRDDATAHTLTIVDGGPGTPTLLVMPNSKIGDIVAQFNGTNWLRRTSTLP